MILNDNEIFNRKDLVISPITSTRNDILENIISYGVSSFGYDIRLGNKFLYFNEVHGIVDPKNFPILNAIEVTIDIQKQNYIDILPNSFVLGQSFEHIVMPDDCLGILLGKSTYARCGICLNCTPIEPGWRGYITLEIANLNKIPARIYINEGIGQLIFLKGNRPQKTYGEKARKKYQDQQGVTGPIA